MLKTVFDKIIIKLESVGFYN